MPAAWSISHWPKCGWHVFLSHAAEDRQELVLPVYRKLRQGSVFPWIDQHDYPSGRDPFEVLREELLRCRHIVYFVTSAALRQGRGWGAVERSYGILLQQRLRFHDVELCHVELPLFFVRPEKRTLQRSIWRPLIDKGRFFLRENRKTPDPVTWAVNVIDEFVRQEERWGIEIGTRMAGDSELQRFLTGEANLMDRVLAIAPLSPDATGTP